MNRLLFYITAPLVFFVALNLLGGCANTKAREHFKKSCAFHTNCSGGPEEEKGPLEKNLVTSNFYVTSPDGTDKAKYVRFGSTLGGMLEQTRGIVDQYPLDTLVETLCRTAGGEIFLITAVRDHPSSNFTVRGCDGNIIFETNLPMNRAPVPGEKIVLPLPPLLDR